MSVRTSFHLLVALAIGLALNGVFVQGTVSIKDILDGSLLRSVVGIGPGAVKFLREYEKYRQKAAPDVTPCSEDEYDFIVVGAGTAGATIASRLSEVPDAKVLLLEAGQEENLFLTIPLMALYLQLFPSINWGYKSYPSDKYCLGMNDNRCSWARGKIMGGSSMLNFMIATRCSPEDYDDWEKMGATGWSWEDVFPYFKKLENLGIPVLRDNKEVHNTEGPVPIEYPRYRTKGAEVFLEAGKQFGFPIVDYNDHEAGMGFSFIQGTVTGGMRASSNRAYIRPVRCRNNLHVSKDSMVERILMDKKGKRAIGVEFSKNGKKIKVFAKNEVIISAGAIGSPQLLMVSGIGPSGHLKDKGIDEVQNSPGVGQNLMDHIAFGGIIVQVNDSITARAEDVLTLTKPVISDFLLYRKGPMNSIGACEAIAFMDTNDLSKRHGRPNLEIFYLAGGTSTDPLYQKVFNVKTEYWQRMFTPTQHDFCWSTYPVLLKPKSRGYLELATNNIYDHPYLHANYLEHPDDVKTMIDGIRLTRKLSELPAWQKYDAKFQDNVVPGCESYTYDSDDYWECAIRHIIFTIYHYSGTCKMGSRDDPMAVVDPSLKVIGVEGLRVCDASVMPEIVSGHPNIPIFMIAEKFSDQLKKEYGYPIHNTSGLVNACDKTI